MRTACVWLLVQNKARAEPWTSWDTTKIANASETAIRAHETAIMSAAPPRRALSGTLRISAPKKIRVTNCETAASATIIPTSTVLYPTAMANIGTTIARVPRANENNTVAAMLRILSAPDRPAVCPLQDDGTPALGRSPVREPARLFLRCAGLPADMFEIGVRFFQTDNIAVFVVNVEKAGEVRQLGPVSDALLNNDGVESVGT